jgi:hypothetical protein
MLDQPSSKPFWETPNCPLIIKFFVPEFFGDRFGGKEIILFLSNLSSEELRGLRGFCIKRLRNLNSNKKFRTEENI